MDFIYHQLSTHLFLLYILTGCEGPIIETKIEAKVENLEFIESYPLEINDPSGLTLDISGEFLWTVSDDTGELINSISFSGEQLNVITGYKSDDMEAITMNTNDGTLWIAEEKLRQIIQITTDGEVLQVIDTPVETVNSNDGLEGIAWNPQNNHLFILNEKNPRTFFELDNNFEVVRSVSIDISPPFDMLDLSGLEFVQETDELWMLSDDSEKLMVTDLDLKPLRTYKLPKEKFEGIAIDQANDRLYLVNDGDNRLYVYQLPD